MKYLTLLALFGLVAVTIVESRAIRDTSKSKHLILNGRALLETVTKAITKLQGEKRDHEVSVLKTEEARLKVLLANYEKAVDQNVIEHIAIELKKLELKLRQDLEILGFHTHFDDDEDDERKKSLLLKATELEVKAALMIKELKAEKNNLEAAVVESELAVVKHLAELLKKGETTTMDIERIESQLLKAEERLLKEIKHPIGN